jgi:non-ribosomal peptide synthetase component F
VNQFLPFVGEECHILNGYGPAEATVSATLYEVRREELSTMTSVPIAPPMLTGYRMYLLDQYRQPVVPGQQGEIVMGGQSSLFPLESRKTCML